MPHYFDEQPGGPARPRRVSLEFAARTFEFETASGVFSGSRVDPGTRVLLDTVVPDLRQQGTGGGRLLDLGCGYGPVGIVLKRVFPVLDVTFSDVNRRALDLAEKNARANQVSYARYVHSDGWARLDGPFDIVVTNPPIRAGKAVVRSFFRGAREHLAPGGRLYVVMRTKQGAPSATAFLTELFGHCDILQREGGYRVLRCEQDA